MGIFVQLMLSALLTKARFVSNIFAFYGKNSVVLLVWHYYLCRILLPKAMVYLKLQDFLYSAVTQIVVTIIILVIMVPVIHFSNKHLGFVFGKSIDTAKAKAKE